MALHNGLKNNFFGKMSQAFKNDIWVFMKI